MPEHEWQNEIATYFNQIGGGGTVEAPEVFLFTAGELRKRWAPAPPELAQVMQIATEAFDAKP